MLFSACFRKKYVTVIYDNLSVIPFEYIAGVTRDGKFAGSMINQSTHIVFMDEWTNDSLCCEDAKNFVRFSLIYSTFIFCNYSTLQ